MIEFCTEVVETDPGSATIIQDYVRNTKLCDRCIPHRADNVKALFRRAKAHAGAWNPEEAKADFERVSQLDQSLTATCSKEIQRIEDAQKRKDQQDRVNLSRMFNR